MLILSIFEALKQKYVDSVAIETFAISHGWSTVLCCRCAVHKVLFIFNTMFASTVLRVKLDLRTDQLKNGPPEPVKFISRVPTVITLENLLAK